MRDLIGVGLALFLGIIGIFFAYGVFGSSNSNSQIQAWPDDRKNLSDHSGMVVEIPDRR